MIRVTVWNENVHEKVPGHKIREVYPLGIHGTLAAYLKTVEDFQVTVATLDMPECGLPDAVLDNTDVLVWWGHAAHDKVPDELAKKIQMRVNMGMGFVPLHSAHESKPFKLLAGTPCTLRWRDGDFERLWNIMPSHPIAAGIGEYIELEQEEMYGEQFAIPQPDEVIFLGWFSGGEVFRSGCTWHKGYGKIFYFQPGHETFPSYHNKTVLKIIENGIKWAAPTAHINEYKGRHIVPSLEEIRKDGSGKK